MSELQKSYSVSEETRRKMREAHKGKHYPKISEAKKGEHSSPKTEFKKGHKINLGKHRSEESRNKIDGKNNPNWKGGLTPINTKIRNSIEFRLWRKAVFERDNFTCQKCGQSGGHLEAHHINNFADYPELRFAIDNGITLCKHCHREFHKKYDKKNNTRQQLEEFLARRKLN